MTRSLSRWLAAILLAAGSLSPAVCPGQVVMSLSDEDPSYPIATAAEEDEEEEHLPESSPAISYIGDEGEYFVSCDECCYVPRNWVSADYLMWWTKGNSLPPLVTGGPTAILPASEILFGNDQIDKDLRDGVRLTFGHWSDPDGTVGWQATAFSVFDDDETGDYANGTNGALVAGLPILGRPFFNIDPAINDQDARLISFPNTVAGAIQINSSSEMHSVSWNVRQHFRSGCKGRMDLIGGYRYFRFREGMQIREDLVLTGGGGLNPAGTTFAIEDRILAENDFHGGDLGFIAEFWHCGWSLEVLAKVALGNLRRSSDIYGSTVTTVPGGAPITTNGGFLALPTNSGHRSTNDFAALPEFGVNAKFEASSCMTFNVGYTLLMLNDVVRSGELIDTTINGSQLFGGAIVGPARPTSQIGNETDFWAQGLNFGVTITR